MSPYRVVVINRNDEMYYDEDQRKSRHMLLSARLSIDSLHNRYIYISKSTVPVPIDVAATYVTSSRNSIDVGKYEIIPLHEPAVAGKYGIFHIDSKTIISGSLDDSLKSCLIHAMNHHCQRKNLRILKSL